MPPGPKPIANPQRPDQRRHPVKHAAAVGWQHGDPNDKRRKCPSPPEHLLLEQARTAWDVWFTAWWASFWALEDLPGLELVATLYDGVLRGQIDVSKLTPLMDRFGLTPKGRQDLRWAPPDATEPKADPVADELGKKRAARKLA